MFLQHICIQVPIQNIELVKNMGILIKRTSLAAIIRRSKRQPTKVIERTLHSCRPLNSHGLTVRLTVLGLFSRSHGKVLISHCHSFNLTVTHCQAVFSSYGRLFIKY